jgi:hypothetical protein
MCTAYLICMIILKLSKHMKTFDMCEYFIAVKHIETFDMYDYFKTIKTYEYICYVLLF